MPISDEPKDPIALLVQAVVALPAEDRNAVLAWLLRSDPRRLAAAAGQIGYVPFQAPALPSPGPTTVTKIIAAQAPERRLQPGGQQVVPVRFPAQQHAALRDWCTEHGFSMATVIRGLVARFLESQVPPQN
jgi:hypothetical protein